MLTFHASPDRMRATAEAIEARITQESAEKRPRKRREKIVAFLRKTPAMTRRQLAKQIGITEDSVKHHLDRLRSAGVLRHFGPTKGGHWEILK